MKLQIRHPDKLSLETITKTVERGEVIYRSPHVGNVNARELSLILGLEKMGASVQLEMVDTIRGTDSYSLPRVALCGGDKVVLASNKKSGKIVGACTVDEESKRSMLAKGLIDGAMPIKTLKDIHMASLCDALPSTVEIAASSEYFARIGRVAYKAVLAESMTRIARPLRQVAETGTIVELSPDQTIENIYGLGEDPDIGVLPPLEAMMAIEILKLILEQDGKDVSIVHVAGPDMIRYTKDEQLMSIVEAIAKQALLRIGRPSNVVVEYTIPCMEQVLQSKGFDPVIDDGIASQYDLIASAKADRVSV